MSGLGEQIRRRIDDLLFERPPTRARLTAADLLLLAGIGLAAIIWRPSCDSDPSRLPFVTVLPASGSRFKVNGTTRVVDLERGLLLVRRAPARVEPRVPSAGGSSSWDPATGTTARPAHS